MTIEEPSYQSNKLIIDEVIYAGFNGFIKNIRLVFNLAVLPVSIITVNFIIYRFTLHMGNNHLGSIVRITALPLLVFYIMLSASYGISFKRFYILGMKPNIFYFGKSFWIYYFYLIVFGIVLAIFCVILVSIASIFIEIHSNEFEYFSFLGFLIFSIWLYIRYTLFFVAKTVEINLPLGDAFLLMNGNVFAYFFGSIIIVLPIMLPKILATLAIKGVFGQLPIIVELPLFIIAQFLSFAILALSSSIEGFVYKRLVADSLHNPLPATPA